MYYGSGLWLVVWSSVVGCFDTCYSSHRTMPPMHPQYLYSSWPARMHELHSLVWTQSLGFSFLGSGESKGSCICPHAPFLGGYGLHKWPAHYTSTRTRVRDFKLYLWAIFYQQSDWLHCQDSARGQHNSSVLEIPHPFGFPHHPRKRMGPNHAWPWWSCSYSLCWVFRSLACWGFKHLSQCVAFCLPSILKLFTTIVLVALLVTKYSYTPGRSPVTTRVLR